MRLDKSSTGIQGLDEITGGGVPRGHPTLVCGGAGCGKTLLGMQFLAHGALAYGEPGVFLTFEETAADLAINMGSLGIDLDDLTARRLLLIDFVRTERSEIAQSGVYDLEGLFIRLGFSIESIGAKRVVLDSMEALLSGLPSEQIVRAELRRMFLWLRDKGMTAIITGESGNQAGQLTRQGLEEYVSDCVIVLDNRVKDMISARRLRVVKYRGSSHGANEYPFLIDEDGIKVLPVTSLGLQHEVSLERVSSGVAGLDAMLGGAGFFRGSSVLVSGAAGTGKSSLAAHFTAAACKRGERVLYFAFEESCSQITRNMASIGIDMAALVAQGMLRLHASRPTLTGLEMHLITILKEIDRFDPGSVVLDPLNSFVTADNEYEVKMMLLRLVDALKCRQITGYFTSLTEGGRPLEQTDVSVSSLIDTWLLVREVESGGERNRGLCILKSRGMSHSNQIREFTLTDHGIDLRATAIGTDGAMIGSAREEREAHTRVLRRGHEQDIERKHNELILRRAATEAQIAAIRAESLAQEAMVLGHVEPYAVSDGARHASGSDGLAASHNALPTDAADGSQSTP